MMSIKKFKELAKEGKVQGVFYKIAIKEDKSEEVQEASIVYDDGKSIVEDKVTRQQLINRKLTPENYFTNIARAATEHGIIVNEYFNLRREIRLAKEEIENLKGNMKTSEETEKEETTVTSEVSLPKKAESSNTVRNIVIAGMTAIAALAGTSGYLLAKTSILENENAELKKPSPLNNNNQGFEFTFEPESTIMPTITPTVTLKMAETLPTPTAMPTPIVTATPRPTEKPTPVVTATPRPTAMPTAIPTAVPAPRLLFNIDDEIELGNKAREVKEEIRKIDADYLNGGYKDAQGDNNLITNDHILSWLFILNNRDDKLLEYNLINPNRDLAEQKMYIMEPLLQVMSHYTEIATNYDNEPKYNPAPKGNPYFVDWTMMFDRQEYVDATIPYLNNLNGIVSSAYNGYGTAYENALEKANLYTVNQMVISSTGATMGALDDIGGAYYIGFYAAVAANEGTLTRQYVDQNNDEKYDYERVFNVIYIANAQHNVDIRKNMGYIIMPEEITEDYCKEKVLK